MKNYILRAVDPPKEEARLTAQKLAAKGENHHNNSKSFTTVSDKKRAVTFFKKWHLFSQQFLNTLWSYICIFLSQEFLRKNPGYSSALASVGSLISETVIFPVFYFLVLHDLGTSNDKTCDTCSSCTKTTPPEL